MKISIVLLFLIIPCCTVQKQGAEVGCSTLAAEEVYIRLETEPDALFLDTRILSEYAEERIPGARFAGNRESLDDLTDGLDREIPIYIYCGYEDRSETVCRILTREKNFRNVYILKGGFDMWEKTNLPVDTSHRQVF